MTNFEITDSTTPSSFIVQRVNYSDTRDSAALRAMLNVYAQDPMGGGAALAPQALERLCDDLAQRSFAFSFLAWRADVAIGLVNCFEGYSTFKARPLVNIHDIAVHPSARGMGVGQALLQAVQAEAVQRGACKLTLEVLTGNAVAQKSYERFGFAGYQLDPAAGNAVFLQKLL
jgi:ribosomal protein S18 acetylase RimI-like enzyme